MIRNDPPTCSTIRSNKINDLARWTDWA